MGNQHSSKTPNPTNFGGRSVYPPKPEVEDNNKSESDYDSEYDSELEYGAAAGAGTGAGADGDAEASSDKEDSEDEIEKKYLRRTTYNFHDIVSISYSGFLEDIEFLGSYCAPKVAQDLESRSEYMWTLVMEPESIKDAIVFIQTCKKALQGHAIKLPWLLRCSVNTVVRDLWIAAYLHDAKLIHDVEDAERAALTSVKDILRYNILHLQGKTYTGIVMHGPVDGETIPLLSDLVRLHHFGVYTIEGQPSLIESGVSAYTGLPYTNHQRAYLNCMVRNEDWPDLLRFLQRKKFEECEQFGFGYVDYTTSEAFETEKFRRNRFVSVKDIGKPAVSDYMSVSVYDDPTEHISNNLAQRRQDLLLAMKKEFTVFLRLFALKSSSKVNLEKLLLEFYETRPEYIPLGEDVEARLNPFYSVLTSVRNTMKSSPQWLPEETDFVTARAEVLNWNYENLLSRPFNAKRRTVSAQNMPPPF
jgi:hypothetical protein